MSILVLIPTFLLSDGLHTPACGLSLWQHKNSKLPDSKPCKDQRADQGRMADTGVLCHKSGSLLLMEVCVCRAATLRSTRQLSRATPTWSTFCSSTVPQPTGSLWSVHPHKVSATDWMSSDDAFLLLVLRLRTGTLPCPSPVALVTSLWWTR